MKLATKLQITSENLKTTEECVKREIVSFFADKFASDEMMRSFERNLSQDDIRNRKKIIFLDFWTYIPGCSETYFGLLGKEWKPEDGHSYEHNGVNLKNIYKDVLLAIAELARENFEKEGFEFKLLPDNRNKLYKAYIIEVSW